MKCALTRNNPGGAGAVARAESGALIVLDSVRAGRHLRFDRGESVAGGGEELEVGHESRSRVPPALAVLEAGLD